MYNQSSTFVCKQLKEYLVVVDIL